MSAPAPDYEGCLSKAGAAALRIADQDLHTGVYEEPPGSNRGPRIDAYLRGPGGRYGTRYLRWGGGGKGAPYCGLAIETWFYEGCQTAGITPCPLEGKTGLAEAGRWVRAGLVLRPREAAPGDVGLVVTMTKDLVPRQVVSHVVLIANWGPVVPRLGRPVTVWTREGNHHHRVAAVQRPLSDFGKVVRV